MSRSSARLCLVTALVSALATGCGKVRQISSCRAVAQQVNTAVTEIEALSKAKTPDELRIAQRYGELSRALAPRGVGVTPVANAVRDYISVVQATEAALKARAEVAKQPSPKLGESTRELDRLVKRERAAAARIDAECGVH